MIGSILRPRWSVIGALLLLGSALPLHAQLSDPFARLMGNNYTNGLATVAGPASTATSSVIYKSPYAGVPVVSPDGSVVISNGQVARYSTTGTLIWDTMRSPSGFPPRPSPFTTYGTSTSDPPAIGVNGSGYNVYVPTSVRSFGYSTSLVALDLNGSGSNQVCKVNWACQLTPGPSGPFIAGSPVVGPDNTVYCVDSHSNSMQPHVFAFKQGASANYGGNVVTNLKWSWVIQNIATGPNQTTGIMAGFWQQPILYTDSKNNNYLVLVGSLAFGPTYMNDQTGVIGVVILKDAPDGQGNPVTVVGSWVTPFSNPTMSDPTPPHYTTNGSGSLSPVTYSDGNRLIIPYVWMGTDGNGHNLYDYGILALIVNVPTGAISLSWPSLPEVHTQPANGDPNFIDAVNPSNPVQYIAAIDANPDVTLAGVYSTTAVGNLLIKRRLSDGAKLWTTPTFTGVGAQIPALD